MPRTSSSRAARVPDVAIVVSRYNATVTGALLDGAREAYVARGGDADRLRVVEAPGAYELPALSLAAAATGRYAGVLALGCVIKGETSHDRYISHAVAQGLIGVTLATGVPCAFGVLTVDTPEQALARAGGEHGNKGDEGMHALLDTIEQMSALADGGRGSRMKTRGNAVPDKVVRAGKRRGTQGKR